MDHHDVDTLWKVSGINDFTDFLTTVLPVEEWAWYDLYLRVLYHFRSQTAVTIRAKALAIVLTVKTNGETDPQNVSIVRADEAPHLVLQENKGGNPELVRRVYSYFGSQAALADPRSRYVVPGSEWQQEAASFQHRFALRLDMGATSQILSGEPDLVGAYLGSRSEPAGR